MFFKEDIDTIDVSLQTLIIINTGIDNTISLNNIYYLLFYYFILSPKKLLNITLSLSLSQLIAHWSANIL